MREVDGLFRDRLTRPPNSASLVCLFAFAKAADMLSLPPLDRSDQQLIIHRAGSLAALIGIVPATDYCGADAERRLADIAWLAPRARRHAELIAWAMQLSAVFPAPFGTLYSSRDSLTAFMLSHETTIANFLHRVAGKEEWEFRATARLDNHDVLDQLACSTWPDWQELPKGTRYMRLCRDKGPLRELGRTKAAALAGDVIGKLQPLTADVRQRDVERARGTGETEFIARYALLVATENVAALQARAHAASVEAPHQLFTIALSGPWPPFSFRPDLKPPDHRND
jgi:hypothetical protein